MGRTLMACCAATLLVACSSVVGESWPEPEQGQDIPFPETRGETTADLAALPDGTGDAAPGTDIVPEVTVDLQGPKVSGCIACHTDKETLVALAPEEEPEEEVGGG